jgi:hypothetical protein
VGKRPPTESVPADPTKWSASSQQSVSATWTTEYTPIHYSCWRCKSPAVFSAEDQRYTYEVKKASINQQRVLCRPCWDRSNAIAAELDRCQSEWNESKPQLSKNREFLSHWLALLTERDEYVAYKPDTAKVNMLKGLLSDA